MVTTTHMLMAAFVTTRPRMRAWMVFLGWFGGFFPDLPMFVMVGMARLLESPVNLWRQPDGLYWLDPWRTLTGLSHSIPIWAALALVGWAGWQLGKGRVTVAGLAMLVFSAGALIHSVADLLVHTHDAHSHFLPLSDFVFHSPVSYYQRDHFGREFSVFELGFCLVAGWFMFRWFRSWTLRALTVLMVMPVALHTGAILMRGVPG
ncbi:MAG: hypothetical protein KKH72_00760 [Alphaproteobacteria bacterium]|nr:hypothetical protein [Alphaproteobacteria bacterium]